MSEVLSSFARHSTGGSRQTLSPHLGTPRIGPARRSGRCAATGLRWTTQPRSPSGAPPRSPRPPRYPRRPRGRPTRNMYRPRPAVQPPSARAAEPRRRLGRNLLVGTGRCRGAPRMWAQLHSGLRPRSLCGGRIVGIVWGPAGLTVPSNPWSVGRVRRTFLTVTARHDDPNQRDERSRQVRRIGNASVRVRAKSMDGRALPCHT